MEAYQSAPGGHLIDAIEKAREYSEGAGEPEEVRAENTEVENERSLQQLNTMLRGVK